MKKTLVLMACGLSLVYGAGNLNKEIELCGQGDGFACYRVADAYGNNLDRFEGVKKDRKMEVKFHHLGCNAKDPNGTSCARILEDPSIKLSKKDKKLYEQRACNAGFREYCD